MKQSAWEKLIPYFDQMKDYFHLGSLLNYDIQTNCPSKAIGEEAKLLEKIATLGASMQKDPKFIALVKEAGADSSLTPIQKKMIREQLRSIELLEKMSLEEFSKWTAVKSKSNEMWRKYRPLNDFKSWLPYWEEVIAGYQKVLSLQRKPEQKTLYDVCLDNFEPGESEALLDSVFGPLKDYLTKKLREVLAKQKKLPSPKILPYDVDKQRKLSLALLKVIDYDMEQGCLRESPHPFSDWCGRYDSRVTTKFLVDDWRSNAFTCLHEGGHCLEFQNWSEEEFANYADGLCTSAICETHSRFYENIIGRSKEFAPIFKAECVKTLGLEFAKLTDEEFLYLINKVEPGLIRCEADELTYSLHIIIRYEIERDLINGKIKCRDVPAIWNKKYKDYLGVDVPNDKDGCMQDVHWTDAEIGYFPSYALGNIYGAQILNTMKKQLDFSQLVKANKLHEIKMWFAKNDFCDDWMDPTAWIMKLTGEKMNPKYYIDYLEGKF